MGIHYLKMRIGFDMRPFLKEETGVGIYFKNLLFTLAKIDRTNEYFLFTSSWKDRFDPGNVPSFAKKKFVDLRYPVKAVNFFWYRLGWPALDFFFKTELDLTHSPTPLPLPTRGKRIITVHDLFFLDFPRMTDKEAGRVFARRLENSVQDADGIVAVSHHTKRQLSEKFILNGEKIRVIHHGISLEEWEGGGREDLERTKTSLDLPADFLLFVGAHEPRKNLPNLIKTLKIVHDRHRKIPLVLVGRKGLDSDNIRRTIQKLNLGTWVKTVGYVDEKELKNVYRLASVFVFPSLWEGFGIPLLEAMASRLPIVASRSSALPEIAEDAAVYVAPGDPEDMADQIIRVLEDEDLQKNLVSAGEKRVRDFTWEKAAGESLDFYNSVLER